MVFGRLGANLRQQLRSFGSFTRRAYGLGLNYEKYETRSEELLQKVEQDVARMKTLHAEHADEISAALEREEGNVEQFVRRQQEMLACLRRVVTNEADMMDNNFRASVELLKEFQDVFSVLQKRLRERERSLEWRMNPLASAGEREQWQRLIATLESEGKKLIDAAERLQQLILEDLEMVRSSFANFDLKISALDLKFENKDAIKQIVHGDLQAENVHFRDISNFRRQVKESIKEIETILKSADFKPPSLLHTEECEALRDCRKSLGTFEQSYFELLDEMERGAVRQYHLVEGELREILDLYERISKDIALLEAERNAAKDVRQRARIEAIKRRLEGAYVTLRSGTKNVGSSVSAVASNVKNSLGPASLRANRVRITAALTLLAIGAHAIGKSFEPNAVPQTKQEHVMVLPSQEEVRAMVQRADRVIHLEQPVNKYMSAEFASNVERFVASVRHELQGYDTNKFTITFTVGGHASPDRKVSADPAEDARFAENNRQYGVKRAVHGGEILSPRLSDIGPVVVDDSKCQVAPLPRGTSLDEVRAVARKVDIQHANPHDLSPREQEIYKYLQKTRSIFVIVTIKEKPSEQVVKILVPPAPEEPAVLPGVPELPPGKFMPRFQSVQTVKQGGQGSYMEQKNTVAGDYVRDFRNDLRNQYLNAAQMVRKAMTSYEARVFDAAYGLNLLRNEWDPIRFSNALALTHGATTEFRYQKLMGMRHTLFGTAGGMVDKLVADYGLGKSPILNRKTYG